MGKARTDLYSPAERAKALISIHSMSSPAERSEGKGIQVFAPSKAGMTD